MNLIRNSLSRTDDFFQLYSWLVFFGIILLEIPEQRFTDIFSKLKILQMIINVEIALANWLDPVASIILMVML